MKLAIISAALLLGTTAFGQTYEVSPSSSKIEWEGTKVVGGGHQGNLSIKDASITFDNNKPKAAKITVDMKSITNADLKKAEWNKKLVDHLHSDDFFSTKKHPEALLVISKFTPKSKNNYRLNGKLTIKGISKDVQFDGKITKNGDNATGLSAKLEFDRTEFNVRYGSGKFFDNLGDKMISDTVTVKAVLNLKKPLKTAGN
ncbi:MAG: YceI family protein [Pseudobacteriovorax sp.]|nr:YceI family protein [Pseudobacteriovorax sp.]